MNNRRILYAILKMICKENSFLYITYVNERN